MFVEWMSYIRFFRGGVLGVCVLIKYGLVFLSWVFIGKVMVYLVLRLTYN